MKENEVINTKKLLKVAAGGALVLSGLVGAVTKENKGVCTHKTVFEGNYAYCTGENQFMVVEKEGVEHNFDGKLIGVYEKDGFILVGANKDEDCNVTVIKNGAELKLNHDIKYPWRVTAIKEKKIDYYTVDYEWLTYKTLDVEKDQISIKQFVNFGSYSYMNIYPTCYK